MLGVFLSAALPEGLTMGAFDGHRMVGVAQKLVDAAAVNALAKGFDAVVTDATNPTSQHVFAKQGFEALHEVRYDSFAHNGTTTFASIANLGTIKLMEKRL
jgi:alcohol dehydrogenase class IV